MTSLTTQLVAHQPVWADPAAVPGVLDDLAGRHPLVSSAACHALRRELSEVAAGRAFVVQGGDCAEPFADARGERVHVKAAQLEQLADLYEATTGMSAVRIGRFAGQYAKPRSHPTETTPDGREIPVFLGEAVNAPDPDERARRMDVRRLLTAYDHAVEALDSLFLNRFLPIVTDGGRPAYAPTYISHEALLLQFERALLRPDHEGGRYASSAHLVWIGERTRALDGAHLAFAESIANPVGVKVGPTATAREVAELVDRLGTAPGRLTLIVRMGADAIREQFPALLAGLDEDRTRRVVWLSDPMHGNTRRTALGQKTRVLTDVMAEVRSFFAALTARDLHPGGLHLELTPDPVTECVDEPAALVDPRPLPRFESTCDPRLDPPQAEAVVRLAAELSGRSR